MSLHFFRLFHSFPRGKTWKMISLAYAVIFSFSNADNSFVEKGFTHILLPRFVTLLAVQTQSRIIIFSSLLGPFVDSHHSPRGPHDMTTPDRSYYPNLVKISPDFGQHLGTFGLAVEPWLDQTHLICRQSVPKRYD